jgi:glucoamylase
MKKSSALKSVTVTLLALVALSFTKPASASPDFEVWIQSQKLAAETKMYANFSPAGSAPGTILASPSKAEPNYYYYWVRDGALVMQSVFDLYRQGSPLALDKLETFVKFSRENQLAAGANLGEPRFNVDGSVNTEPWGRPQNDGPALRALLFTRLANQFLAEGRTDYVRDHLYAPVLPANSVIKADLEFVAHHWQDRCIDLWEEVWGHHFFTRASQYLALKEGALLAEKLADEGAAAYYRQQARALEAELGKHWSHEKGYYISALEFSGSADHQKPSQLDVSVILAALVGENETGILSLSDDRLLQTAMAVEDSFKKIYGLNKDLSTGTAIGRYPEDHYFGGNPWVLTTAAYAEFNYRLANQIAKAKSFVVTDVQARYFATSAAATKRTLTGLRAGVDLSSANSATLRSQILSALEVKGDRYLERIRRHANADGSLSEQYGRDDGEMLSARDLSWSYASFLRAVTAREKALGWSRISK